jgi:hypothetical protein
MVNAIIRYFGMPKQGGFERDKRWRRYRQSDEKAWAETPSKLAGSWR